MNKKFEFVKCDFCDSSDTRIILRSKDFLFKNEGIFQLCKCNKCGSVFTNPRPKSSNLYEFYPNTLSYYDFKEICIYSDSFKGRIKKKILKYFYNYFNTEKKKVYDTFIKFILFPIYFFTKKNFILEGIFKFKKNGKILDIGCSYGSYLNKMKKLGWNVYGIEFNEKAKKFCEEELLIEILNSDLLNVNLYDEFNIVNMGMYLEHVESPLKILRKARNLLKKDGIIVITVPNFNGIDRIIWKKFAYNLHLPNHLYHFTPDTIKAYLKKAGFRNIKIIFNNSSTDLIKPFKYFKGNKLNFLKLMKIPGVFKIADILFRFFRNSSRMTITANK